MHAGFCLPGGNVSAPTNIECGIIIDWLAIKKHRQNLSFLVRIKSAVPNFDHLSR